MSDWAIDVDELARLWDDCRRCAFLAAARWFPRPAPRDPEDSAVARLARALSGQRLDKTAPGAPDGRLESSDRLLSSAYDVPLPDRVERCALRAAIELVVREPAGATPVAVVVGVPGALVRATITRRLHAAAWALERPARGGAQAVAGLGMLVWQPGEAVIGGDGVAALTGTLAWEPVTRDDAGFLGFLAEAATLLSEPSPPAGTALCPWCVYRDASRRTAL